MNRPATQGIDPLSRWVEGVRDTATGAPVPLVSTAYDIRILGALAVVKTRRVFRNAEAGSIEATLTFPVPVHGVMFALAATIDGRTLTGQAQRRQAARETYEAAIDHGRTAVLHEEVLRGIHMLSVAHVPPGAEIAVEDSLAMALTASDADGLLRIPVTVGDIYGRSPLPDSDDLLTGGAPQMATITIAADSGRVRLNGVVPTAGQASVRLNRPIDVRVEAMRPRPLGAELPGIGPVRLAIEPAPAGEAPLDCDILIDQSGSMGSPCGPGSPMTKHEAVVEGLRAIASTLRPGDRLRLWEFADTLTLVGGATSGADLQRAARALPGPHGGTEIGGALRDVTQKGDGRDVIILTDGQSHALDVQALAHTGRRFSVVLVGADSLEANVGHLAALSGGELFVAVSNDIAGALSGAVAAVRAAGSPGDLPRRTGALPASTRRGGMAVSVTASAAGETLEPVPAATAFAASVMLPSMNVETAADLAERVGLVTHLTSLVLVDEAGAVSEGLPATRKVALEAPMYDMCARLVDAPTAVYALAPPASDEQFFASREGPMGLLKRLARGSAPALGHRVHGPDDNRGLLTNAPEWAKDPQVTLLAERLARLIDWSAATNVEAVLAQLDAPSHAILRELVALPSVSARAQRLGRPAEDVAIGLAARHAGGRIRTAARLARRLLGDMTDMYRNAD